MNPTAMVFAPAPQLTVTIEAPADELELHIHPGGQGIWQARMITSLGVSVTLCACLGGEVGPSPRAADHRRRSHARGCSA